jgi:hypothetical protein
MKYFQSFPFVKYDTLGDGVSTTMTDFTPNFKVRNASLIKNVSYMNHTIGDGERPDITSHMLYGTTAYHWTFFTINDHLRKGISEWPLSQSDFDNYISSKYGKYACITFDPTQTGTSLESGPNLSFVPFTEQYIDSLYLAVDTADEVAYRKIISYDTLSCQMTIERANPVFTFNEGDTVNIDKYNPVDMSIENFISLGSYRIVSILFDSKNNVIGENAAFVDFVNASYGLDEEDDATLYYYDVALDGAGNNLNYELMKNAPFQFYTTVNDENTSLSTYDVIAGNMIFPNVNRITYEEMEGILNDRKRTISVINPANIAKFAESYFTVLNNG